MTTTFATLIDVLRGERYGRISDSAIVTCAMQVLEIPEDWVVVNRHGETLSLRYVLEYSLAHFDTFDALGLDPAWKIPVHSEKRSS